MYSGCGGPLLADQNPNLFASPLLLPPVDNTDEYTVCVVFTCCFSPMRSHWCGEACTLHLPEVSRHYGVVVKFCFWPVRSRFDPRPVQKLEPTPTVLQTVSSSSFLISKLPCCLLVFFLSFPTFLPSFSSKFLRPSCSCSIELFIILVHL